MSRGAMLGLFLLIYCADNSRIEPTVLAGGLVTTRETERVEGELVADGTAQLEGNFILRDGAKLISHWLSR